MLRGKMLQLQERAREIIARLQMEEDASLRKELQEVNEVERIVKEKIGALARNRYADDDFLSTPHCDGLSLQGSVSALGHNV